MATQLEQQVLDLTQAMQELISNSLTVHQLQLNETPTISDEVGVWSQANDKIMKLTISQIIQMVASGNPTENTYDNIAEMLSSQASQTVGFSQMVSDSSDDPDSGSLQAVYAYTGLETGDLKQDYIRLSDSAVAASTEQTLTGSTQTILNGTGAITVTYNTRSQLNLTLIADAVLTITLPNLEIGQSCSRLMHVVPNGFTITFDPSFTEKMSGFANIDFDKEFWIVTRYTRESASVVSQFSNLTVFPFEGGGGDMSAEITAAASKSTPVDADVFGYLDSENSNTLVKATWLNIKDESSVNPDWNATSGKEEILNKPIRTNFNIYNQNKTNAVTVSNTTKTSIILNTSGVLVLPSKNLQDSYIGKVFGTFNAGGVSRNITLYFQVGTEQNTVITSDGSSPIAFCIDYVINHTATNIPSVSGVITLGNSIWILDLTYSSTALLNFNISALLNGGELIVNSSYLHRNFNS